MLNIGNGSIEGASAQPVEDMTDGEDGQEEIRDCELEFLLLFRPFIGLLLLWLNPTETLMRRGDRLNSFFFGSETNLQIRVFGSSRWEQLELEDLFLIG